MSTTASSPGVHKSPYGCNGGSTQVSLGRTFTRKTVDCFTYVLVCTTIQHFRPITAQQYSNVCILLAHTLERRSLAAACVSANGEGGHPARSLSSPADSRTPQDANPAVGTPAAAASAVATPNVSPTFSFFQRQSRIETTTEGSLYYNGQGLCVSLSIQPHLLATHSLRGCKACASILSSKSTLKLTTEAF